MTEMQGIEKPLKPTSKLDARIVGSLRSGTKKTWKWLEIKGLQAAEKYLRARALRLLLIQAAGALVAFHGIEGWSHRVAWLVLGVGIILAAERQ